MSKNPEYTCSEYCEVDHIHKKKEVPNVSKISNKYPEEIYDELNGMINAPMISESREEACIKSIIDAVVVVL